MDAVLNYNEDRRKRQKLLLVLPLRSEDMYLYVKKVPKTVTPSMVEPIYYSKILRMTVASRQPGLVHFQGGCTYVGKNKILELLGPHSCMWGFF